jgi:serine/threonine-protein kinase
MSRNADDEYFSDGLAEEIINLLAHIPGLKVIARTSAFAFKGQNTDVRKIAAALGVTSILEGSVRRAGSRIRVTAQLITAADGSHVWSERYDRQMEDIFELQDQIAAEIASVLKVKLSPGGASRRRQPNLQAYEAYLRYRHYQWSFTPESLRRSRECLEQAIALDPEFALPYVGLADFHLSSTLAGLRTDEAMAKARDLAQHALEIDPDLTEAHAMLGIVAGPHDFNWKEAERQFRIATAVDPIPWHVRSWYSFFHLFALGRFEEARRQAERALQEDPLSQILLYCLAAILDGLGLVDESRAAYGKMVAIAPQFWWGWVQLGMQHAIHGRNNEARECAEKAMSIFPGSPMVIGLMAAALGSAGETVRAEELLAQLPEGSDGFAEMRTYFHLACGEIDAALEWAGKAVDNPIFFSGVIRANQLIFRKCAAWPALLEKMNLDAPSAAGVT